jgi:hypothetical protein
MGGWVMVDCDVCWCGFSIYCHVYEWLQMGFGLMIEFIGPFDMACDYPWQFTIAHMHAYTHTHPCPQSCLHLPWLGHSLPWQMFPFLWVPELSLASATSFSQEPNLISSLINRLTNSVTHQLTQLSWLSLTNSPADNISAWTAQRKPFHYFSMETCLFAKLLLSHSCCIAAAFPVIAWSTCHNIVKSSSSCVLL